jgi:hypothetical protein
MTREEIYDIWAPPTALWSIWAKPVLFAHLPGNIDPPPLAATQISWAPATDGTYAIVVDLPGVRTIHIGMALAAMGYRPVPLFNAAPGPRNLTSLGGTLLGPIALVPVWPIADALAGASATLRDLSLPVDAPPVFLLDADRRTGRRTGDPGDFDNRSVSFPTDFPSGNLLLSRGISSVLLVQKEMAGPNADLAHTLRRWQETGLQMHCLALDESPQTIQPLLVRKPSRFRWMWHNDLSMVGLRRNPLGGFGGTLPEPSAG